MTVRANMYYSHSRPMIRHGVISLSVTQIRNIFLNLWQMQSSPPPTQTFGITRATHSPQSQITNCTPPWRNGLFSICCFSKNPPPLGERFVNAFWPRRSPRNTGARKSLSGISIWRTLVVTHLVRTMPRNFISGNLQHSLHHPNLQSLRL